MVKDFINFMEGSGSEEAVNEIVVKARSSAKERDLADSPSFQEIMSMMELMNIS